MDRTAKYIRELKSSAALMRKYAARYLKDAGDARAIQPLAEALSTDPRAEVRAEAAATLGHIGDPTVLDCLEQGEKDEDRSVAEAAADAITRIRERYPKPKPAPPPAAPPAPAPPAPRSREELLDAAVADMDAAVARRPYGCKIRIPLLEGRSQTVRLVYDRTDPDGDPLLLLFTVCGEVSDERLRWALKANARLPYGALAIREAEGKEQFILLETLLESDATEDGLRKALLTLAEKGDLIERKFFRADAF